MAGPMPSSLPECTGGEHHAQFEHLFDLDLGKIRCPRTAGGARAVIEDAVDAADQPLERGAIELIGSAETMHHTGFSPLSVGVPNTLGEGVVGDG